jgi:hypothetical protein
MSAPDKDGGGGAMPSKVSPGSSQWGENEKEIGRGEDAVFFRPEEPMFDGADRLGVITIKDPDATKAALKSLGMSVPDAIAASGVCPDSIERLGISPPRVTISPNYGNESDPLGTRVALFHVRWSSAATQGDDNDDSPPSVVGGERSFYRSTDGSGFSIVAQTFHINLRYRGNGIALEMMENMINSGATEIIMREASRDDAGGNSRYALTGYSEWPKYGYDCPRSELRRAAQRRSREVPPEYSRARSLLDVYATPGGREWWKESGDSVPLRFDCTPGSRSMQVFDAYRIAARAKHDRRSQIEARPAEDSSDCDFDPVLDKVWDEIEKAGKLPGKVATESRSSDCGREDDGRFSSGNKCAGPVDMPKEDPKGRMRYDNGVQTDAARKLYQMGSSEKRLKSLVDVMGGDPKSTRVDINPPSLNISVADKDGNKLFHVDLENGRARLYPAKDLTPAEATKIKEAAGEAFGGRQADTTIKVFSKAEDMKKWESENAAKLKKWEDKYAFSTLLPPHQRPKKWERSIDARHASLLAFAESRGFCPNGEGNGVTNTCSSKEPSAPEPESDDPPPALHLLAESDAEAPQTKIKSGDGEVAVVDRTGISTPDYLDEIECHGRNCGLEVTFQLAKQLQPNSEIEDDWSPLDAYVGPGSGYFTGYDGSLGESADSSIDYHGGDYGTIDDYAASDLLAEKQKEVEKEWDDMSDDEKNVASMKLLYGRDESPPDDEDVAALRSAGKKQWMDDNTFDIEESINAMREDARINAVAVMSKQLNSALAADTIECCLQLYRGMNIDATIVDRMISSGYVVHEGANSWTTSRGTARSFGANKLLLVTRKPRVGHIFASNAHDEEEVIRPPSRMRIIGVVRTSTGTVLHVDEDEDYKEA